jgi:iron-sulfur cluster repair protein YtfE (RIC family)
MTDSTTITDTLTADHRRCDLLLTQVDRTATTADWQGAGTEARAFADAMERHFRFEEDVLFQPLEAASPMAGGPTHVMRMEHMQIRHMLADLLDAVMARDADEYAGLSDTLHMLVQQHNAKEEGILYPLADRALGPDGAALLDRLDG